MQIGKCIKSFAVIANNVNTTFPMIELNIISFKFCLAKCVKHFFNNFKFKVKLKICLLFMTAHFNFLKCFGWVRL